MLWNRHSCLFLLLSANSVLASLSWLDFLAHCSCGTAFGILSGMFSEAVLDHFRNPRNAGELSGTTVTVEGSNPVCSDILKLSARSVDGRIVESRFLCRGCTTAIPCASFLTEQISGHTFTEPRNRNPKSLPTP